MKRYIGLILACICLMGAKHSYTTTPAKAKDFTVTCGTSATEITTSGLTSITEVVCFNINATPVYVGGSDVGTGFPICSDTGVCGYNAFPMPVKHPYCKVGSGTVVINCFAVLD